MFKLIENLVINFKKNRSSTFKKELKEAIKGAENLLDVGCGSNSPIRNFNLQIHTIGVDAFEPSLEKSKRKKIHSEYKKMDVLEIGKNFKKKSIDCVMALDLIEHLTKEQGNSLLDQMESIAKKKVIVFTPNGFVPQGEVDKNPWQVHISGWTMSEMSKRGYHVIGINGLKYLRGEFALIKFKPKFFWRKISNISQGFFRNKPQYAYHLFCIKTIP